MTILSTWNTHIKIIFSNCICQNAIKKDNGLKKYYLAIKIIIWSINLYVLV